MRTIATTFYFFFKCIYYSRRNARKELLLFFLISCYVTKGQINNKDYSITLERNFKSPSDSIQTSVYWYWLSDNISEEGVEKDLEAMKRVGINRAFIGNIGLSDVPYGKVKLFSAEWWNVIHAALKKATELNIEIGMFNSPGWSQSGGPWIKPNESMRYLAATHTVVEGGKLVQLQLPTGGKDFQDVKVLAYPAPMGFGTSIKSLHPQIRITPQINNVSLLFDGNTNSSVDIPSGEKVVIDIFTDQPYIARNLEIYPARQDLKMEVELQAKQHDRYQTVKKFLVDRSNNSLNVGFEPYAPVSESFEAVLASEFRITITHVFGRAGVTEIELSSIPKVERYVEKTLAKMFSTPLPYWREYQWPVQAVIKERDVVINPLDVIDISTKMDKNGILNWDVPNGKWIILRTGMMPTGVKNSPASKEGAGLEVDKMSSTHIASHFNNFMGEIIRRIPAEDRKTWKLVVQDSYEMGGQNWTDDFIYRFTKRYGYSPVPYIPAMYGDVVGSQDISDRFLWDLRRFVADNVAYEYVGGLRKISHKYGMKTWLGNYGHWGFPGEFLQYGGQSDEIGGEFWSEGELGDIENRAASSSAHIYGKQKVSAESFTAAGKTFARYPALMKQRGDRFFTEGINNTLLHVYIHQPYENRRPGMNAWFGNEFNRFNTWYNDMDLFTAYLKRCNFMLQQGTYVVDVAYFIGEDAPKMTGITDPELPKGYAFDYINAEVIEKRLAVRDGRFVLPDGLSYRVLVLPKLKTIRPELLKKIAELVQQGGIVLGPRPDRSPSLQNYGKADEEIKQIADLLWGNVDGRSQKVNWVGKGIVIEGMDMQEALSFLRVLPDVNTGEVDSILYIHRTHEDAEIYFISNQSNRKIEIAPDFRVTGKTPEYWNPINGEIRSLPSYSIGAKTVAVPLTLYGLESMFIIFKKATKKNESRIKIENFPAPTKVISILSSWTVKFDTNSRGPINSVVFNSLSDWTVNSNDSIRHYSGTASYINTFNLDRMDISNNIILNLGDVVATAKVWINGNSVGGVWAPPYSIDVTKAVKKGKNELRIEVSNTWVNRLIGDQHLPISERRTWAVVNPYKVDSPLEKSGLLGPVTIQVIDRGTKLNK